MFIGGTPTSENIIKHWQTMNMEFTRKDNVFVVSHPKKLDENITKDFSDIFKPENVYKVDEAHHVPTGWGTLSLVDALLLMMQYAHRRYENFFDKYILLSSSCCPLYRMDVIYDEITKDDMSVMGHEYKMGERPHGDFWMILDKRHSSLFFGDLKDTYKKTSEMYECQQVKKYKTHHLKIKMNEFKSDDPIKIRIYNYLCEYYKFLIENPCKVEDEYFIIDFIYIVFGLKDDTESVKKHFRMINRLTFGKNLQKVPSVLSEEMNKIKTENAKDVVYLHEMYDNLPDYWLVGNNVVLPKIGYLAVDKDIPTQSVYHHMISTTEYNPSNVLREFSFFDISDVGDKSPLELKKYISKKRRENPDLSSLKNEDLSIIYGNSVKYIMAITSHPIEYEIFTLKSIVDTFVILMGVKDILLRDRKCDQGGKYHYILYVYLCILVKEFDLCSTYGALLEKVNSCEEFIRYIEKFVNFIDDLDVKYREHESKLGKKYGTFITSDILVEAMCHNSFFIRKCFDTSLIETYSSLLSKFEYIESYPRYKVSITPIKIENDFKC